MFLLFSTFLALWYLAINVAVGIELHVYLNPSSFKGPAADCSLEGRSFLGIHLSKRGNDKPAGRSYVNKAEAEAVAAVWKWVRRHGAALGLGKRFESGMQTPLSMCVRVVCARVRAAVFRCAFHA